MLNRFLKLTKINRFYTTLEVREWTKVNDSWWQVIPDTANAITTKGGSHMSISMFFSQFIRVTSGVYGGTLFKQAIKLWVNEPKNDLVAPN